MHVRILATFLAVKPASVLPGLLLQSRQLMLKPLSIMGYVGMVAAVVGLLATRSLFSSSLLVVTVQGLAFLLLVWARLEFGRRSFHVVADPTAGGLVTTGPYRYIRHPIYTSLCVFVWAAVAANWSWTSGLCAGLVLGSALIRIHCEEKLVEERYPEYAQYRRVTWRMIPWVY